MQNCWAEDPYSLEKIVFCPLFLKLDVDQVRKIVEILGTPPEDEIQKIQSDPAKKYLRQLGNKPGVKFEDLFPKATSLGKILL